MMRTTLLLILMPLMAVSSGCLSSGRQGQQFFRDASTCGFTPSANIRRKSANPNVAGISPTSNITAAEKVDFQTPVSSIALAGYLKRDTQKATLPASQEIASIPTKTSETSIARTGWAQSVSPSIDPDSKTQATITLTLDQAEQTAITNNPDLRKSQAEIDALHGKYVQTGLRPNPQVGYTSSDVGEEGTAGQQGAFVSQEFIRGGKLKLNRSIVSQEIAAAKQQLEINRQKLMTEVRQRFYDLLIAQERINLVQKFSQLSQSAVSISGKLYQAQEISKIADLRAQLQAKNITIISKQADNDLAAATRRLAAVLGIGQPDTIKPGSIVATGFIYTDGPILDPERSFNDLLAISPEMSKAAAELEQAKWNLHRQIAEPTRNVQVQTSVAHGNVSGDDLVAVQVGVPLRINDRNQGNISSARCEISASRENIASIKRDLSRRFSVAWREYENARIQIEKYQNEIIPAAAEFYDLVESAFREGEMGYLDLVSAQQAYLDASLQNLDALRDFWRSAALIDGYLLSED